MRLTHVSSEFLICLFFQLRSLRSEVARKYVRSDYGRGSATRVAGKRPAENRDWLVYGVRGGG
jgi:hypothetical protein